ncbi:hypothetical protein [Diplocloster hominis]|uniref:hypothetical protein n=1 Tax=Diplocloster hominis TaxID=3079010 RepID=UPI0031BB6232
MAFTEQDLIEAFKKCMRAVLPNLGALIQGDPLPMIFDYYDYAEWAAEKFKGQSIIGGDFHWSWNENPEEDSEKFGAPIDNGDGTITLNNATISILYQYVNDKIKEQLGYFVYNPLPLTSVVDMQYWEPDRVKSFQYLMDNGPMAIRMEVMRIFKNKIIAPNLIYNVAFPGELMCKGGTGVYACYNNDGNLNIYNYDGTLNSPQYILTYLSPDSYKDDNFYHIGIKTDAYGNPTLISNTLKIEPHEILGPPIKIFNNRTSLNVYLSETEKKIYTGSNFNSFDLSKDNKITLNKDLYYNTDWSAINDTAVNNINKGITDLTTIFDRTPNETEFQAIINDNVKSITDAILKGDGKITDLINSTTAEQLTWLKNIYTHQEDLSDDLAVGLDSIGATLATVINKCDEIISKMP